MLSILLFILIIIDLAIYMMVGFNLCFISMLPSKKGRHPVLKYIVTPFVINGVILSILCYIHSLIGCI